MLSFGNKFLNIMKYLSTHKEKNHRLKGNIRLGSDAIVGTIATIVIIIAPSSNLMQYLQLCVPP
jgi:hypothetical protein